MQVSVKEKQQREYTESIVVRSALGGGKVEC